MTVRVHLAAFRALAPGGKVIPVLITVLTIIDAVGKSTCIRLVIAATALLALFVRVVASGLL